MEAHFRHKKKKKKSLLQHFIAQFWLFFSEPQDINTQLRVIKSKSEKKKTDMLSELRVYI